jgi:hypothetical protein
MGNEVTPRQFERNLPEQSGLKGRYNNAVTLIWSPGLGGVRVVPIPGVALASEIGYKNDPKGT